MKKIGADANMNSTAIIKVLTKAIRFFNEWIQLYRVLSTLHKLLYTAELVFVNAE